MGMEKDWTQPCNRKRGPETDPYKYGQLIVYKDAKAV